MIICKIPLRISFFGGGTDFPKWYQKNNGLVISSTINKYCYMNIRHLPPFFSFNYRIRYFKSEFTKNINQIKHPSIRETLKHFHYSKKGLEIIHSSDLPSRSGLGSSSAFTVALIKGIEHINKIKSDNYSIAQKAINLEQNILKEKVGSQDQIACAIGGFNIIKFKKKFEIDNLNINSVKIKKLESLCSLFYTGQVRNSDNIEKDKLKNLKQNKNNFKEIYNIAIEAKNIFKKKTADDFINEVSMLLNKTWKTKKKLSKKVSNNKIDELYDFAKLNGASAGKILGAGAGGFILFLSKNKKNKLKLIKTLSKKIQHVDFNFEDSGASIVYRNKSDDF